MFNIATIISCVAINQKTTAYLHIQCKILFNIQPKIVYSPPQNEYKNAKIYSSNTDKQSKDITGHTK